MRIMYEGTDITQSVQVESASAQDRADGNADMLDVTLWNAKAWYAWAPRKDDAIEIIHEGYTTGKMYVDTVLPAEGKYRIIATSMTTAARQVHWAAWENAMLRDILRAVSAEAEMDWGIYGLDDNAQYPFFLRKGNETGTGFLRRLLRLEGAVLKCAAGRMSAIGIEYAQALDARREITIENDTPGVTHTRTEGAAYAGARVITPYGRGIAADGAVKNGLYLTVENEPAKSAIQAARWARGALLWENRQAEAVMIETEFDASMTAMMPIQIAGEAALAGKWLANRAEHDFINKRTRCEFLRCVMTIR
ncbi:hypothetical protein FACS1894196_4600 [Clostridia bacterium]|nr:hypothetical protein FACS1894196_4600 [Clostridia bacterium]